MNLTVARTRSFALDVELDLVSSNYTILYSRNMEDPMVRIVTLFKMHKIQLDKKVK